MGAILLLQRWWYYDVQNEASAEDVVQRVQECHYLTTQNYEGCQEVDCNDVLDCIVNTDAIQDAIAYYSGGSNINGDSEELSENLAGQLVNNPTGCDNDIIYGMTTQLVEFADRLIKDLFEQVKASQLTSENVGYIIKLIPVLETLPLDEAFEFTAKLADDMEVAYLSASTSLLKTEIACELFCLAQLNGCELTLEMVRDYFVEKANVTLSYDSVTLFIADFVSGTFTGNAVYFAMNVLFFQIFAFGGKWIEYFWKDYLRAINAMYNDPNSDWDTECDDCGWSHTFDFTVSDGGWTPKNNGWGNMGVWSSGNGWDTSDVRISSTGWARIANIEIDFVDTVITSVEMTYDVTKGSYNLPAQNAIQVVEWYDSSVEASNEIQFNELSNGDDKKLKLTATNTCDNLSIQVRPSSQASASYSGSGLITKCVVRGQGTNPFI